MDDGTRNRHSKGSPFFTNSHNDDFMRRCRRAVTLLELVAVVGICGILAAVLLSAVQRARESIRRTSCQNNLRQTALAVQSFESAKGHIPSLYNGSFLKHPVTQWDEYHFHSWQWAILPQLEQSVIYDRTDQTLPATHPSNQANVNTELAVFICPSTSNYTPVVPDVHTRDGVYAGTAARSDYEAVGGMIIPPKAGGFGNRYYDYIQLGIWGLPRYDHTDKGTFDRLYRTRFRDVTDGLSNTVMIAERAGRPDTYVRGKPDEPYAAGDDGPVGQPAWAISGLFSAISLSEEYGVNESNQLGIYSFHAVGANAALADGSVRLLPDSMDRKLLHSLMTRAGGEVASD